MYIYLIIGIGLFFVIHSIVPTYYNKIFNSNVVRTTSVDNEIMLTFDDGPDSRYIYDILEVLDENDVRATFFMVAKNAENDYKSVEAILSKGHRIGLHSWEHKNAMLYSYFYTKKDFENSVRIMKTFGVEEFFYRPPWGHSNIFTNFFVRKYKMKLILWDVMAEDWLAGSKPEDIRDRLLDRVKNNSIICLHDAGENSGGEKGATLNTIGGLKLALPLLKEKGYNFVLPK